MNLCNIKIDRIKNFDYSPHRSRILVYEKVWKDRECHYHRHPDNTWVGGSITDVTNNLRKMGFTDEEICYIYSQFNQ